MVIWYNNNNTLIPRDEIEYMAHNCCVWLENHKINMITNFFIFCLGLIDIALYNRLADEACQVF